MERGDEVGDLAQVGLDGCPRRDQRRQPPVLGHPSHHDEVVADGTVRPQDVSHTQVHVRSQAAVELDLAVAHGLAGRDRC